MYICINPNSEYNYTPSVNSFYEPSYTQGSRANFIEKLEQLDINPSETHYLYSNGEPDARLDMALDAARAAGYSVEKVTDKNPIYNNTDLIFEDSYISIPLSSSLQTEIANLADQILPHFDNLPHFEVQAQNHKLGWLYASNATQNWYVYGPELRNSEIPNEHKDIVEQYGVVYNCVTENLTACLQDQLRPVLNTDQQFRKAFMRFIVYTQEVDNFLHRPHSDFCTFTFFIHQSQQGLRMYNEDSIELVNTDGGTGILIPSVYYPEVFYNRTPGLKHDVVPTDYTEGRIKRWALTCHII